MKRFVSFKADDGLIRLTEALARAEECSRSEVLRRAAAEKIRRDLFGEEVDGRDVEAVQEIAGAA